MFGKAFLSPLKLPKKPMSLGTIAKLLAHRRYLLLSFMITFSIVNDFVGEH